MFSAELLDKCIASPELIKFAKKYGEKRVVEGENVILTAYVYNGGMVITSITKKELQ